MRSPRPVLSEKTRKVQVGSVSFRVREPDGRAPFWDRVDAAHWEPHTFDVLRRFLRPDASCIDIGAWIGPTALYSAHLARYVHAIEPDPVALAELTANAAANPLLRDKLRLHSVCITPHTAPITLYAGGMYHSNASTFGDSMSGILPAHDGQPGHVLDGIRLDEFIETHGISDCGFIKMDVEGGEYMLIPWLWRDLSAHGMPTLYVSFHAPPADVREAYIGACIEELRLCYRHLYDATDRREAPLLELLSEVHDWADEAPDSPWRRLERLLGDGLVATNMEW